MEIYTLQLGVEIRPLWRTVCQYLVKLKIDVLQHSSSKWLHMCIRTQGQCLQLLSLGEKEKEITQINIHQRKYVQKFRSCKINIIQRPNIREVNCSSIITESLAGSDIRQNNRRKAKLILYLHGSPCQNNEDPKK